MSETLWTDGVETMDGVPNPDWILFVCEWDKGEDPFLKLMSSRSANDLELRATEARALAAALTAWADRVEPEKTREREEGTGREWVRGADGVMRRWPAGSTPGSCSQCCRPIDLALAEDGTCLPCARIATRLDALESHHKGVLSTLRDLEADVEKIRQGLRAGGA